MGVCFALYLCKGFGSTYDYLLERRSLRSKFLRDKPRCDGTKHVNFNFCSADKVPPYNDLSLSIRLKND